ncbi:hypothetical protein EAF04_007417 [Stromatinia cepivora]|nr:hypothetical protein EAF04_007417 [Stromatinia cepivora]
MESVNNTVNNMAAAASKAIWGESQETTDAANATVMPETKGTEPVSGEMGDTKKGEPYDKGNLDSTSTKNTTENPQPNPFTTLSPPGQAAKSIDPSRASSTSDIVAKTLADTHIAPLSSENPSTTSFKASPEKPLTAAEKPLISERINPNLPLRSENQSTQIGGTDTLAARSGDVKSAGEKDRGSSVVGRENADAKDLNVTAATPKTPGGGTAGENKGVASGTGAGKPSSTSNVQDVKTDLQPLGSDKKETIGEGKEEKGTGEKHITTTGTAAEGGNFDATKPGAGIEADRLLGKEGKVEKMDAGVSGGTVGGNSVGGDEAVERESGRSEQAGSEEEHEHEHEHGEGKKEGKLTHLKEKIKGSCISIRGWDWEGSERGRRYYVVCDLGFGTRFLLIWSAMMCYDE